jgi:hypothetical protein
MDSQNSKYESFATYYDGKKCEVNIFDYFFILN